MLFCALVIVPLSGGALAPSGTLKQIASFVLRTLLLLPFNSVHAFASNPSHSINVSVWSISYEFYCYILLVLLSIVGILKRRSLTLFLFGFSIAGVLAIAILAQIHYPDGTLWHRIFSRPVWEHVVLRDVLIPEYLAGVVFFLYRDKIPHRTALAIASFVVLGICCFVPYSWIVGFPLAGTYLVFWFGFHPRIKLHHFARYGDMSYGTYLYAFPIQQLVIQWHGAPINPALLMLLATPPSMAMSLLSWHLVEKWFLSSHRKRGMDGPLVSNAHALTSEVAAER
jgi:peptidoglycan/LPS O-acetylase OafA/YrhL